MLLIAGFIILFFLFYYIVKRKYIFVNTVSPAIVMSLGIFSLHVEPHFHINFIWYWIAAFITILLWMFFIVSYIFSIFTKDFITLHYESIIGRFRIGTWVASTSVVVMIIHSYFPELSQAGKILVYMNTLLWIGFSIIVVRSLFQIIKENRIGQVNGILFLTAVSTQSIVLMHNTVWNDFFSIRYLNYVLVIIGLLFYLFCFILLIRRYTAFKWSLTEDWLAPNCMFHGALSITGAAMIISAAFPPIFVQMVWYVSFFLFIIVEIMEVIRGTLRIKKYGFTRGLCIYEPSQWSRIFTFCMFYMFTSKLNIRYPILSSWVTAIQEVILRYGKWVIACFIVAEIILFIRSHLSFKQKHKHSL